MRENTTGPVRGDRTEARPGGSPVPTFSEREQAAPGDQRRIDDAAARREPLTEPVPVAGGGVPGQHGGAARRVEQTGPAGAAVPKQDDRRTGPRDVPTDGRDGQQRTEQLDANRIPEHAGEKAGTRVDGAEVKNEVKNDGVKADHAKNDGVKNDAVKPDGAKPDGAKPTNGRSDAADDTTVLFGEDAATGFRTRWRELQADFVDDPKRAVEGADKLVDEVMHSLTQSLTKHKQGLAGGWQDHGETEELRQALRKYRSFLDQLLKT